MSFIKLTFFLSSLPFFFCFFSLLTEHLSSIKWSCMSPARLSWVNRECLPAEFSISSKIETQKWKILLNLWSLAYAVSCEQRTSLGCQLRGFCFCDCFWAVAPLQATFFPKFLLSFQKWGKRGNWKEWSAQKPFFGKSVMCKTGYLQWCVFRCQNWGLTAIFLSQSLHVVKSSPPYSELSQDLNFFLTTTETWILGGVGEMYPWPLPS